MKIFNRDLRSWLQVGVAFACVVVAFNCSPAPHNPAPDAGDAGQRLATCDAACAGLRTANCDEGKDKHCEKTCEQAAADKLSPTFLPAGLLCLSGAMTAADVKRCNARCTITSTSVSIVDAGKP